MKSLQKKRIGVCDSFAEYIKLAYGSNALKYNGNLNLAADIRDAGNILYLLNTDGIVSILSGWDNCVKIKIIFG